jgi:hypothetical protein
MPSEMISMMYIIAPIHMDDQEFLRVSEVAGKRVKEKRRDSKLSDEAPKNEDKYKDNKENKIQNKKYKKQKTYKNNERSNI